MTSRLVLCLGDLFIPDRASVSQSLSRCLVTTDGPRTYQLRYASFHIHRTETSVTHPSQFKKLLTPGKIGQILCLGNLTSSSTYTYLQGIAPDLHLVKGDFDVDAPNLPLQKVVSHGGLRIGFTHGHTIIPHGDADSLLIAARQMDVDVLLWGGNMKFEAYEMEGKFFVSPGSATGAVGWGWGQEENVPSFVLMDVS